MTNIWTSHVSYTNEPCPSITRNLCHDTLCVLQWVAVSCSELQWVAVSRSVFLQCVVTSATHTWRTDHFSTTHVAHAKESCLMYEWVMSHVWMSHVPLTGHSYVAGGVRTLGVKHMNELSSIFKCVTSHTWMSHVTHIQMSRVTHTNESCHLRKRCVVGRLEGRAFHV